jgi:pimeloyl-ACP methyl ester carboxylesterase
MSVTLVTEEMSVPSDPGIDIYVRNKRPENLTSFSPARTLLFVHGSTYPASSGFDLPLGGQSWMEYIAARGYDVYCLDLPGYGRSTRPKAMSEPPQNNPPVTRTPDAVKAITAVLNAVLKRRNIPQINLLGWSWGCALMSITTVQNLDKVRRLMLHAPSWIRTKPPLFNSEGPVQAYRLISKAGALERWLNGVPEHKKAELIPAGWFEQWTGAMWASDPDSGRHNPPLLRAPNGTLADTREFWMNGKALYDPARITVPTLIAVGEWDNDTPPALAQTIFPLLVNSPGKRLVQLAEGTHHMMFEKNRLELFKTVQTFLDEGAA